MSNVFGIDDLNFELQRNGETITAMVIEGAVSIFDDDTGNWLGNFDDVETAAFDLGV